MKDYEELIGPLSCNPEHHENVEKLIEELLQIGASDGFTGMPDIRFDYNYHNKKARRIGEQ